MNTDGAAQIIPMVSVCVLVQKYQVIGAFQRLVRIETLEIARVAELQRTHLVGIGDDVNLCYVRTASADEIAVQIGDESHVAVHRADGDRMQMGCADQHPLSSHAPAVMTRAATGTSFPEI